MNRLVDFLRRMLLALRPHVIVLARRSRELFARARAALPGIARAISRRVARSGAALARPPLLWLRSGGPRRVLRRVVRSPIVRVPILASAFAALALGAIWAGVTHVPPGRIGVRQIDWGPGGGIVPRDYTGGLHVGLHARSSWHWIESATEFLRFAWKNEGGENPALEVRTKEGNTAQISVTVPYRVKSGEAHRIVSDGVRDTYKSQAKSVIEAVLLQELAAYRSEDLYLTDTRRALCASAAERMNVELAPLHLEALGVYLSGVWFPATYEKKLQESQLESQDLLTKQAQKRLAEAAWRAKLVEEEIAGAEKELQTASAALLEGEKLANDSEIARIQREADEYTKRRRAEADAEYVRLAAEGELAPAQAEAEREKLANQALDSTGGRLMLARDAAANLRFQSVTLDSSDPRVPSILDLDELSALLLGK